MGETAYRYERNGNKPLKTTAVIIGILAGLAGVGGAVKAWVVIPFRIDKQDADIQALKSDYREFSAEQRANREILIRIEERLKQIERAKNNERAAN